MKEVTRYQAADGTVHDTPEAARLRDHLCGVVAEALQILPEPTDAQRAAMADGLGYLRHDPVAVVEARRRVLEVAKRDLAWWVDRQPGLFDPAVHPTDSNFGKVLELTDNQRTPVYTAWRRLSRIGVDGREWSEARFAVDMPDGAVDVTEARP